MRQMEDRESVKDGERKINKIVKAEEKAKEREGKEMEIEVEVRGKGVGSE